MAAFQNISIQSWRFWSLFLMTSLLLWVPSAGATDAKNPLKPIADLSSPRATLTSFLKTGDVALLLIRNNFRKIHRREDVRRLIELTDEMQRALDLSQIPPASRFDYGREQIFYLYEILSRIELPSATSIPDETFYKKTGDKKNEEKKGAVKWRIPNTELTLQRIVSGPRIGEFVFDSATVARLADFYRKTRSLDYLRDVPLKNFSRMRTYLSVGNTMVSSQTIESFPGWLKQSLYNQAIWKWIALVLLLVIALVLIVFVQWLARRNAASHSAKASLRPLMVPFILLLMPIVFHLANRQLTLTGGISIGMDWLTVIVRYFALAWITWAGTMIVAEYIITSPKISDKSLNAHLIRLIARAVGIVTSTSIFLYMANQLGAPVYSLVAGLGIGGIAFALAARPTLENFIGGLNLFGDRTVRVGDSCFLGGEVVVVEEIGLRSTRLRKEDDTLVSIPNADFSQRELTNRSKRRRYLYKTTLNLRYETTSEQLLYFMVKARGMLGNHPKILSDKLRVRFMNFGASSLDVYIFAYVSTRDRLIYESICEDLNFKIMNLVNEAGTGFAFPSRTTYVSRDTGLDTERQNAAEAQVQNWRLKGQFPSSVFDETSDPKEEGVAGYPPVAPPGSDTLRNR